MIIAHVMLVFWATMFTLSATVLTIVRMPRTMCKADLLARVFILGGELSTLILIFLYAVLATPR